MTTILRLLRAAFDTLRYDGVLILMWKVTQRLLSPLGKVEIGILLEKDISQPLESRVAKVDVRVNEATPSDIEALIDAFLGNPLQGAETHHSDDENHERAWWHNVRERFRSQIEKDLGRGDRCFVAKVGDEIVHVNWTRYTDAQPIPGIVVQLGADEIFTTDAFTFDAWRGKGIHHVVLNEMLRAAQSVGCRHVYTMTDIVKTGSRRGVRRLGWSIRSTFLYIIPRWSSKVYLIRLAGNLVPLVEPPGRGDEVAAKAPGRLGRPGDGGITSRGEDLRP